jgi:hypothetical protein
MTARKAYIPKWMPSFWFWSFELESVHQLNHKSVWPSMLALYMWSYKGSRQVTWKSPGKHMYYDHSNEHNCEAPTKRTKVIFIGGSVTSATVGPSLSISFSRFGADFFWCQRRANFIGWTIIQCCLVETISEKFRSFRSDLLKWALFNNSAIASENDYMVRSRKIFN